MGRTVEASGEACPSELSNVRVTATVKAVLSGRQPLGIAGSSERLSHSLTISSGKEIAFTTLILTRIACLRQMEPRLSIENLGPEPIADDPRKEIQAKLAQFVLSLIQAFLRTGYYTPDHPESKRAKVGLYEDFQTLFIQKDELTFLLREDRAGQNILIEGVLPETQFLSRLMLQGMAEMYIPKFAKFLERKDLISLSLKNTMTRTEFTSFVDVMSEPTFVDTHEKRDKERFSQTLKERGIFNISYIFNEELLAMKRNLPWRSHLALTRLKKDLRMIPLYTDLDAEGFKKVRRGIIQDITRPIKNAEVIYHVLMNTDLVEVRELKESEIDKEVVSSLPDDLLLKTSQTLLDKTLGRKETETLGEKTVRLIRWLATSLNQREIEGRESVLEEYFKNNLISFEQLPAGTQQKIKLEQLTKKFLRYSTSFFDQFDRIQDREKYLHVARTFTRIIPELIRQDRYEEILKIVTHIDRHFNERKNLSIYAGQILEEIGKGKIPAALKEKFLTEKKEVRVAIAPIFLKLHVGSVPYLISLLNESSDQWVRKHAGEILVQIGPLAINSILDSLNKREMGTESTIDILRVLGEIKSDKWTQPLANTLQAYLGQENPRLREEALRVYDKVMGSSGEKLYLRLLNDPDPGVRKTAIQSLGRIKSKTGLAKFLEMLKTLKESPSDKNEQVEARLFGALGFYGNVEGPGMGLLEDFLLETLDRRLNLGPLTFLKKKKNPLSDVALAAVCETLGKIGTEKSRPILEKLEKQRGSPWENKASEALKRMAEREGNHADDSMQAIESGASV